MKPTEIGADQVAAQAKYHLMVNNSLISLLKERKRHKKWQDSEVEDESQSLVFKQIEALTCFLMPFEYSSIKRKKNTDLPEGNRWFFEELKGALDLLEKNGFDPNPYTYTPKDNGDFVDCASSVLELLILVWKHLSKIRLYHQTSSKIEKIASKACDCLLNQASYDPNGQVSWAANHMTKAEKQDFSNVYFTSYAIRALSMLVNEKPWQFVEQRTNELLKVIENGAAWLISRHDKSKNVFYFDSQKNTTTHPFVFALSVTTFLEAKEYLSDPILVDIKSIIYLFIKNLSEEESSAPPYLQYLLVNNSIPAFYDNRLTIGTIVFAICELLRKGSELLPVDMEELLYKLLQRAKAVILNERGQSNDLWPADDWMVSASLWGIRALVCTDLTVSPNTYILNEHELYGVIKKCLTDSRVIRSFLIAFQENLLVKEESSE